MKKYFFVVLALILVMPIYSSCTHAQNQGTYGGETAADIKRQWQEAEKADEERENRPSNLVPQIKSMNRLSKEGKIKVLELAEVTRRDLQNVLRDNLDSDDLQVRSTSAYLVGAYHLTEMAGDLANMIAYEDNNSYAENSFKHPSLLWYWGRHPAAEALVELGLASVPSIMSNLKKKNQDKAVKKQSLWVLENISGHEDKELARLLLEREIKRNDEDKPNNDEKKSLLDALSSLNAERQENKE